MRGHAPGARDTRVLVLLAALVVAAWGVAVWFALHDSGAVDLGVYRTAASVWRHGMPVYGPGYPFGLGQGLPFTYPPFGLLPFSILAALPMGVALAAMTALGLLAVAVTTRLAWGTSWSATATPAGWSRPASVVLVVLAVSAAFEPVVSSFYFGQINLVLMVLVAADALLPRTPWPRGLLIGLCAAVKLTPFAFLLFFLCRRDWRAMAWTIGTFLLATGVGALVLPRDSATYWFSVVLNSERVGSVHFAANQSLRGVIFRLGPEPTVGQLLWVVAVVVVLVCSVAGVLALHRRGDDLGALLVTAAAGLLVSPISWNHHFVWSVPALIWLVRRARAGRSARCWAAVAVTLVVFVVGPYRFLPNGNDRELAWTWWQHLVGDAYAWAACALVVWAAYDAWRCRSRGVQPAPGPGRRHEGGEVRRPSRRPAAR